MSGPVLSFDRIVNGLSVHAEYTRENVEHIFLPLLRHMTVLQSRLNRRLIVFLAAPPAAGKSTLAEYLQVLSETTPGLTALQAIGMDGFHHYQEYLLSHTCVRDGDELPLIRVKGAPVTFDLSRLAAALRDVRSGEECPWPVYDRTLHDPVENAVTVERDIVLIEGNYMLLNLPGWSDLRAFADFTVSVTADPAMLRERLVLRHIASGKTPDEARRFTDSSDLPNARLCLNASLPADLQLELTPQNTYVLCSGSPPFSK